MKEFMRRLYTRPILFAEIIVSTLFITILFLASPLFVIQVLNRYVSTGFTGTLVTLATGMMVAIALQFAFRMVRTKIAAVISLQPDAELATRVLDVLTRGKSLVLGTIPKSKLQDIVGGLQVIKNAYGANSITGIFDAPFALLYIVAIFFISPILALVSLGAVAVSLGVGLVIVIFSNRLGKLLQNSNIAHRGLVLSAANNIDTVRSYQGLGFLKKTWDRQISNLTGLYQKDANIKELSQSLTLTLTLILTVVLYSIGAYQVTQGDLSVGGLIGANILSSRAFSATTRFVQIMFMIRQASDAFDDLDTFFKVPLELEKGTVLSEYKGNLSFKDVSYAYPRSTGPLFESLNLELQPGTVLGVIGPNGSGKTTLIKLISGLLDPLRGEILADGVSLRQISPEWWRSQLVYLPQEPTFLPADIKDTITMAAPGDLDEERLSEIINDADLKSYLDRSSQGLDSMIVDNGNNLPRGIRRRLALARAMATGGSLILFDEPTDGLDQPGCQAVYAVLNKLAKEGRTIVVVTRDPHILKGAKLVLDLSVKPEPKLVVNR